MSLNDWAIERYAWLKRRRGELIDTLNELALAHAKNPVPAYRATSNELSEQINELDIRIDEITRTVRRLEKSRKEQHR